jgi:peptidoglycan/xylan/chitin deacetylase (PgdA/CDA1 family)
MRRHKYTASDSRRLLLVALTLVLSIGLILSKPWQPDANADVAPPPARSPVTVSLTYDDGTVDQLKAAEMMAKYGLTGTFYLNSSLLGASGRLSAAQALALQAAGNEIGGHTVTHADLPTLSTDEQQRQICGDRSTLLARGLQAANFAYPYGDDNAAVQEVVRNCGYNSARVVGGVASPGSCYGCPTAEKLPPTKLYSIVTPDSVKPASSLVDLQNYVLQAEQNRGGWVVVVMHRICDGCDPYAASPGTLDTFFEWLAARKPDGTTVKTVAEVIGGPVKPAVPGPPPAPRNESNQLARNPSMETDTNGDTIPDCWQRGGYGVNTATWSNAVNPKTGTKAMQLNISSYTDGDRRIITQQDLGGCAPQVLAGHTYRVGSSYRSAGSSRPVAYYRDGASRWQFLGQAPLLTATSEWREWEWTTPALPADANALSVGISLRSVGTLAADDLSIQDTDETAPAVSLTSPSDGSRVRGTATVKASATDASGIDHVDFLVDGIQLCTTTTAPYSCDIDTTARPDTVMAVTVRATDKAGNVALSTGRNYTVSNSVPADSAPPTVTLTAPVSGSVIDGTIALSATATDNDSVTRVLFYVDGVLIDAPGTAPYTFAWDSLTHEDGLVRIQAMALDASGNVGESIEHIVTVGNYRLDSTPPTTTATCGQGPCEAVWRNTPVAVRLAATDATSGVDRIMVTTDGSTPTLENGNRYSGPLTISASTVVKYRAWDKAGNAEAVQALELKFDMVAPTARISTPTAGSTVTNPTYYRSDVSDDIGIARVLFYVDNVFLGSRIKSPWQWVWDTTNLRPGPHTLHILARDAAGNETRSESVTIVAP